MSYAVELSMEKNLITSVAGPILTKMYGSAHERSEVSLP